MTEIADRVALLKRIHLFRRLTDAQLTEFAQALEDMSYEVDEKLVTQGGPGDAFYILFRGRVKVTRKNGAKEDQLAVFVPGDYFGEQALLTGLRRNATVTAMEPTLALRLPREAFRKLLRSMPGLRHNIEIAVSSRRLARSLRFKWVRQDEVIYFLARRHVIELIRRSALPILLLLVPLLMIFSGASYTPPADLTAPDLSGIDRLLGITPFASSVRPLGVLLPLILGSLLLAFLIGLLLWRILDWSNDYYIVTNQRVIYLEKVIGLYDSRQESPLSTILSVGVETDWLGRMIGFGNVVVRTFVGRINFTAVGHPAEAAALVEEHWKRAQERGRAGEQEAIKSILRVKLGLPPATDAAPAKKTDDEPGRVRYRTGLGLLFSRNLFRTRFEAGGTITYRKHLFVLFQQTWQPAMFCFFILLAIGGRFYTLSQNPDISAIANGTPDTLLVVLLFLLLPFFGWWLYQYVDYNNDIFQVTGDQIVDIDKTPFGSEQRRSAPLDNILSTEYKRIGLLGNIMNFGTVYITVGGTQLAFEDVFDPASVQADIDRRRLAVKAKSQEAQIAADRDRMSEWIIGYHRAADDLRAEEEKKRNPRSPENPE